MRKWSNNLPGSAGFELRKGDCTVSEQKAAGYILEFPEAADQQTGFVGTRLYLSIVKGW